MFYAILSRCICSIIILLFEQKTAYEMRISDWSSDVCSSDLMATDEILARYSSGLSVKLLRGLIWAALQTNHPCTVDEAGEIIEAAGVPSAKTALEQAILASMPAAEAEEKANPPKRGRAGTG